MWAGVSLLSRRLTAALAKLLSSTDHIACNTRVLLLLPRPSRLTLGLQARGEVGSRGEGVVVVDSSPARPTVLGGATRAEKILAVMARALP